MYKPNIDISNEELDKLNKSKTIDDKMKYSAAYDYICRLEEANVWITTLLKLEPMTRAEFVQALARGIILAQLGRILSPNSVGTIYIGDTREYRRVDNHTFFLEALKAIKLPSFFYFDIIDAYEQKNIPRVIYCLHGLARYLSKHSMFTTMPNLRGCITITQEELREQDEELKNKGITTTVIENFIEKIEATEGLAEEYAFEEIDYEKLNKELQTEKSEKLKLEEEEAERLRLEEEERLKLEGEAERLRLEEEERLKLEEEEAERLRLEEEEKLKLEEEAERLRLEEEEKTKKQQENKKLEDEKKLKIEEAERLRLEEEERKKKEEKIKAYLELMGLKNKIKIELQDPQENNLLTNYLNILHTIETTHFLDTSGEELFNSILTLYKNYTDYKIFEIEKWTEYLYIFNQKYTYNSMTTTKVSKREALESCTNEVGNKNNIEKILCILKHNSDYIINYIYNHIETEYEIKGIADDLMPMLYKGKMYKENKHWFTLHSRLIELGLKYHKENNIPIKYNSSLDWSKIYTDINDDCNSSNTIAWKNRVLIEDKRTIHTLSNTISYIFRDHPYPSIFYNKSDLYLKNNANGDINHINTFIKFYEHIIANISFVPLYIKYHTGRLLSIDDSYILYFYNNIKNILDNKNVEEIVEIIEAVINKENIKDIEFKEVTATITEDIKEELNLGMFKMDEENKVFTPSVVNAEVTREDSKPNVTTPEIEEYIKKMNKEISSMLEMVAQCYLEEDVEDSDADVENGTEHIHTSIINSGLLYLKENLEGLAERSSILYRLILECDILYERIDNIEFKDMVVCEMEDKIKVGMVSLIKMIREQEYIDRIENNININDDSKIIINYDDFRGMIINSNITKDVYNKIVSSLLYKKVYFKDMDLEEFKEDLLSMIEKYESKDNCSDDNIIILMKKIIHEQREGSISIDDDYSLRYVYWKALKRLKKLEVELDYIVPYFNSFYLLIFNKPGTEIKYNIKQAIMDGLILVEKKGVCDSIVMTMDKEREVSLKIMSDKRKNNVIGEYNNSFYKILKDISYYKTGVLIAEDIYLELSGLVKILSKVYLKEV